jgi:hypothetical protein
MSGAPAGEMYVVDSPYEVANWRPLVNWVLVIPHAIIVGALQYVAGVVFLVYWVALIVTGRLYPGMYGFMAMYERYSLRTSSFLLGFTETYPPFDFQMGPSDNGALPPIRVNVPATPQLTPRTAAFNVFLAIPHYVVLFVFGIGAAVIAIIGWFAVLFTGRWPQGWRDFLVRFDNYWLRIWVYVTMVDTTYPRFGL